MSSDTILVTYATRLGSTAGVADAIGEALVKAGVQVAVHPVQEVSDPSPYRAVIMGSAIQNHQWLPEAMDFLKAHQATLKQKPFAAFLVCMTLAMSNEAAHKQVHTWLEPIQALVPTVSEGYFAGVMDVKKIPHRGARWGFRLSVLSGVWKEGDHRNWDGIHAWATALPPLL